MGESALTPEELRELRRLHISTGRRVDSLFSGDYRSIVRGQGMEFEEVREYHPGDDIRHIDWNVTARTGEPFIKVFREERQLTVQLVVDVSGSTRVGHGGYDGRTSRRVQIARIAGGLAYATLRNRDRIGLLTFTDEVEHYLRPRKERGHVWTIIRSVYSDSANERGTSLENALSYLQKVQRRRAVIMLISDFIDDGEWTRALGALAKKHTVHCLLVHDKLDEHLPKNLGLIELVDAETGQRKLVDASAVFARSSLEERLSRVRKTGASVAVISTDDDPFTAMHSYFLKRRGRR